MNASATFDRLRNANVAVVHDETGERFWWLLRSLPAIHYLGFDVFTYPTSWRTLNTGGQFQSYSDQYDWQEYQYEVLGSIEQDGVEDDLVVITTEYYETQTQYPIDQLVSRYTATSNTLVVLTDSPRFTPTGGQRPLYQEQFVESIGSYDRIFRAYATKYDDAGWELPLQDTKNLFLHDNANLYELVEDESISTTEQLFDVLPDAPYLPLYDAFIEIFAREEEYGVRPLDSDDVEGLERWLRRRIEWDRKTASNVAEELNIEVSDSGNIFDPSYAARSPKVRDAREAAQGIDQTTSSIHKRYSKWLQRYDP